RAIGGRDLARQREHQRDGVLGGGDRVAEVRVHDHDAPGGGRLHVDVVDADAGAADDLELLGWGREVSRVFGGRAYREPVIGPDEGLELVGREADPDVDLDATVEQDLRGSVAQIVGYQYLGHGVSLALREPNGRGGRVDQAAARA